MFKRIRTYFKDKHNNTIIDEIIVVLSTSAAEVAHYHHVKDKDTLQVILNNIEYLNNLAKQLKKEN